MGADEREREREREIEIDKEKERCKAIGQETEERAEQGHRTRAQKRANLRN